MTAEKVKLVVMVIDHRSKGGEGQGRCLIMIIISDEQMCQRERSRAFGIWEMRKTQGEVPFQYCFRPDSEYCAPPGLNNRIHSRLSCIPSSSLLLCMLGNTRQVRGLYHLCGRGRND